MPNDDTDATETTTEMFAAADRMLAAEAEGAAPPPEPAAPKPAKPAPPEVKTKTEDEVKAEEDAAAAKDPSLKARLDILARREARMRDKAKTEDAAIEARRKDADAHSAEVAEWKTLRERASKDPIGVLKALGITNMTDVAKLAYATTLGDQAPADIKLAAQSHEVRVLLEQQNATIKRLEERLESRDREAEQTRAIEDYKVTLKDAVSSAGDLAPLIRKAFGKRPQEVLNALVQAQANFASANDGEILPPSDLLALYEEKLDAERREYLDLFSDEPATPPVATKKTTSKAAGETRAAATLSSRDTVSHTKPQPPKTREEEIAEANEFLASRIRASEE